MLQNLELWHANDARDWVIGPTSAGPAYIPPFNFRNTLRLAIHNLKRNPDTTSPRLYTEPSWSFTSIRASIGRIDTAPNAGTFKLRVGAATTADISWPSDLSTAANIAAWKAAVLAALRALAGVGDAAVVLEEPADCPAHHFYFTWTDDARDDEIEVIDATLTPLSEAKVEPTRGTPNYQQLVKFQQLPAALTDDFEFAAAPTCTFTQTRAGSASANELQTLILASEARGGVDFTWEGETSALVPLPLTADAIENALNALLADGENNPGFSVTLAGNNFVVEFTGPLAAANQPLITATLRENGAPPVAVGYLPLTLARVNQLLNGQSQVEVPFEVVITTPEGETSILRTVILRNSMTSADVVQSVEEAGGVIIREVPVYVDSGLGTAFADVSPGANFEGLDALGAEASASVFTIEHELDTLHPRVQVWQVVDTDVWKQIPDNEYDVRSTDASHVVVTFPFQLTDNPADDGTDGKYHAALFKFYLISPDVQLMLFTHGHTWAEVRESLPAGQTLAAKLAALDASIAALGGTVEIDGAQLADGTVTSDELNIPEILAALGAVGDPAHDSWLEFQLANLAEIASNATLKATFQETLRDTIISTTVLQTLAEQWATSANPAIVATFHTLAQEVFRSVTTSTEVRTVFETMLLDDSLGAVFREAALAAWQAGTTLPPGVAPVVIPAIALTIPRLSTFVAGGVTETLHQPLPKAYIGTTTSGATITGALPLTATGGERRVVTGTAQSYDYEGRQAQTFPAGTVLIWNELFWQAVIESPAASGNWYPVEFETELFTALIGGPRFYPGSQFVCQFTPTLELLTPAAEAVRGIAAVIVETGVPVADSGSTGLASYTWTIRREVKILLGPALEFHPFLLTVQRNADGTRSLSWDEYGNTEALADPGVNEFAVRVRFARVDFTTATSPHGALVLNMPAPKASFAKI